MAKAWITDLWLKPDSPKSVVRLLNASKDAAKAGTKIPDEYKKAKYGRGKRWAVQWREQVDGVPTLRAKNFERKTDAEAYATAISDDQLSGRYINVDDLNRTFEDASREWRASQHNARTSSTNQYDDLLRTYVLPQWGSMTLQSINETNINEWVAALREATAPYSFHTKKKPTKPTPKYLNQIVNVCFGGVIRYSLKRGWLRSDPMVDIHVSRNDNDPEREERRKVFLSSAEVEELAQAALRLPKHRKDTVSAAMIRFMAYIGTRPGETYALRVGDIDLDHLRVNVVRSLTKDGGRNWTIGPTKTGKPRRVAIPRFMVDVLRPLVDGRDAESYLFSTRRGSGFIRPENWRNRVFNKAVLAAGMEGIEGLRPHSLRHTFASLSIAAGCDVRTLADALGHSDVSRTLNEYAGLWPDRLDEVASALENRRASALMLSDVVPTTNHAK